MMWNMWETWSYTKTVIWKWLQWSYSKANDYPNMQPIKHNNIRINACPTHKHDAMRATKLIKGTIKQRENKHKVKQGFLKKECLLPLGICISPMTFSLYECAQGRITPPKSVHISHIEMRIQTCILSSILSPFLSQIGKIIKRKEGKKRRYE